MVEKAMVHEGMRVRTSDGKNLGYVLTCEEGDFIVQRHSFSTTDYVAQYEDVADVSGGEVVLSRSRNQLVRYDPKDARSGEEPGCYGDEGGGGHA